RYALKALIALLQLKMSRRVVRIGSQRAPERRRRLLVTPLPVIGQPQVTLQLRVLRELLRKRPEQTNRLFVLSLLAIDDAQVGPCRRVVGGETPRLFETGTRRQQRRLRQVGASHADQWLRARRRERPRDLKRAQGEGQVGNRRLRRGDQPQAVVED